MMSQGEKAIIAHNNALKICRNSWDRAASLIERASALNMLGRVEAAIQDYRSAIQIVPMKRSAYLPLAMCYKELNFLSKSEWYDFMKEIEDSIDIQMDDATKRLKDTAVLSDTHNIEVESSSVYWALYLSAEKAGYYDKAWEFLEKAHGLDKTKKVVAFDAKEANVQRDSIISVFNRGFWPQNIGYPDTTPVFIVGMMRSGSTLLETMLDAHDGIIGLGEDSIFNSNLPQFRDNLVTTIAKQDFVLVRDLVNSFGAKTISRMKSASQVFMNATEQKTITRMIDKMLFNYRNIGFIHLVYPNAVILHTMRDPMDTILSCYTHKFDDIGLTWSLNQEHLTQTYAIYLEIMHHFRSVLPNRIMDVSYEELVNSPEEVMRKVLLKLGLPWDPKVLEYHKRRRMVQTHSSAQVRKNIYKHSVGAWRKYLHQMIPAINSLKNYLKVLEERDALPHKNLMNWNLDPFYDYNDDFKFNISKAEYLKLLEEDAMKRKDNKKMISSSNDKDDVDDADMESDEDDFPKKLKRRRAKKQSRLKKKKAVFVEDDGDVDYLERTEQLTAMLYDEYSKTIDKKKSLNKYISNLKYKHDNSQVNELVALGNLLADNEKYEQVIELLKSLSLALKYDNSEIKFLVCLGLGTAYSQLNMFKEAIETFNLLLGLDPNNIEGLYKRAELLYASGEREAALSDLNKVITLGKDDENVRKSRALSLFELGYYRKANDDFKVALDFAVAKNATPELTANIYYMIGQCEKKFGAIENSLFFYNKSIELMPTLPDYPLMYAITAVDGGLWEEGLEFLNKTLTLNNDLKDVYNFRGQLYQTLGMANEAIIDLEKTLIFDPNDVNQLTLLGVTFQSLGKYDEAFRVFEKILSMDRKNTVWFRKEFISYYVGKLDMDFKQFNIDNDFDPMIKEGIIEAKSCASIPKSYVPYGSITSMTYMRRQSIRDEPLSEEATILLDLTKDVLVWSQLDSPGFLPHKRDQTMFRFCVLEIAQALRNHVNLLHEGKEGLIIPDRMSSKKDYYGVRAVKGGHILGWRDLYDIAVRWQQLSEPKNPIWWIDKLPKKLTSRMGLKTYITKGSSKDIRYIKYYDYTFNITRQYLASSGYYNQKGQVVNLSESEQKDALDATTIDKLYSIVGQPFQLKIQCESSLYPGLFLEGVQISVNEGEQEGYDISLSSFNTPERFIQYEEELHMTYRRLVSSLLARKRNENSINAISDDEIAILNIVPALEMFYYWVNLSPLSSDSATTGYIILFASILAQDEELLNNLPKYKQLDWEAFFSQNPRNFIKTISPWLLQRKTTTLFDNELNISSIFKTPRDILNLLSKA